MPLDDTALQALIVSECGGAVAPAGSNVPALTAALAAQLPTIWALYAGKAGVPLLRYQYALRHAVRFLQGQNWAEFDWTNDSRSEKRSQISANLADLYSQATAEIALLEKNARGARGPKVGRLTTAAPLPLSEAENPATVFDPNSPRYGGDARQRSR